MEEREYPKSPPIFENVDGAGFSDAKQAKLPIEPKQPELMCYKIPSETDLWRLHHAAPFAAVRWTNGIVRLNGLDLQNLQLRTSRLQFDATRPAQRLGLV